LMICVTSWCWNLREYCVVWAREIANYLANDRDCTIMQLFRWI
jgi:hypothetical protein